MAPTTRSNKRKADEPDDEEAPRRRRAPEERAYHGFSDHAPAPQRITRRVAAGNPKIQLNPGFSYTGRIQERPRRSVRRRPRPPVQGCASFDWIGLYRHLEDAPDPNGNHYQRGPPLAAAHNAAMLQSAIRDFRLLNPRSQIARMPPPTWRPTPDGPQSHPITRIRYGNITDAAQARPGEMVVNTSLRNVTTAHRVGAPPPPDREREMALNPLSTALMTSPLPDSHPLLLRAPPPRQGPGLGHHALRLDHAHLPADHPLLVQATRSGLGQRPPQPVDATGAPVPPSLFETPLQLVAPTLATELTANMWGQRRGRIEERRRARDFEDGDEEMSDADGEENNGEASGAASGQ